MPQIYFSLTAGRSGSGWLAKFLSANLDVNAIHEPIAIEDFGTRMPEVRQLRSFNTYGSNEEIQAFWQHKLDALPQDINYAETNHTLGKCGLIEALAHHPRNSDATVIVLRRDLARQCASYVNRHDFILISTLWQWFLAPDYPNRIVNAEPFLKMGQLGAAIWYALEMECRQTYYERCYGDRIRFVNAQLEDVTQPAGAKQLLTDLGVDRTPILPPKTNANSVASSDELVEKIDTVIRTSQFDPESLVSQYIALRGSLDMAERRAAA